MALKADGERFETPVFYNKKSRGHFRGIFDFLITVVRL